METKNKMYLQQHFQPQAGFYVKPIEMLQATPLCSKSDFSIIRKRLQKIVSQKVTMQYKQHKTTYFSKPEIKRTC